MSDDLKVMLCGFIAAGIVWLIVWACDRFKTDFDLLEEDIDKDLYED